MILTRIRQYVMSRCGNTNRDHVVYGFKHKRCLQCVHLPQDSCRDRWRRRAALQAVLVTPYSLQGGVSTQLYAHTPPCKTHLIHVCTQRTPPCKIMYTCHTYGGSCREGSVSTDTLLTVRYITPDDIDADSHPLVSYVPVWKYKKRQSGAWMYTQTLSAVRASAHAVTVGDVAALQTVFGAAY